LAGRPTNGNADHRSGDKLSGGHRPDRPEPRFAVGTTTRADQHNGSRYGETTMPGAGGPPALTTRPRFPVALGEV